MGLPQDLLQRFSCTLAARAGESSSKSAMQSMTIEQSGVGGLIQKLETRNARGTLYSFQFQRGNITTCNFHQWVLPSRFHYAARLCSPRCQALLGRAGAQGPLPAAQAPGYLRSTPCRIIQVLMCSPSRRILDASPDLKF